MKILTFDTSANKMYVTLGDDGRADISRTVENTPQNYHTAYLIPVIIEMLKEKNLAMQDIDAVGVNTGPGSFTGIRASATVARVIGQSMDIPVAGISSLEIFSLINKTEKQTLCLLDARKGKSYIGIYNSNGDVIREPSAIEYDEVIKIAQDNDFFIIADNTMEKKINEAGLSCINLQDINPDFGAYLAELTYKHLKSEDPEKFKWFNLKPLYIQPPPITMPNSNKI